MEKEQKKHKKQNNPGTAILKIMYAFLISILFFYITTPECKIYLILFLLIWGLLLLCYGNRKNKEFLINILYLTFANAAAYIVIKLLRGSSLAGIDLAEILLSMICLFEVLAAIFLASRKGSENAEKKEQKIFPVRQYDLERIREFILQVNILGVNSPWGNGKSFVAERLCREEQIKDAFEIIQIDLLTCNLDEMEAILMNELEKILRRNHIFSKSSRLLKNMLGENKILKQLKGFFIGNDAAISFAFQEFTKDVTKLEKNILVIYEDIDRIPDQKVLYKIFAISEKLAGDKIRILYQYDEDRLSENGLGRDFLEKYIPYVVNLTEMDYEDMVKSLWDEVGLGTVEIPAAKGKEPWMEKKEILYIPRFIPHNAEMDETFGIKMEARFVLQGISIRKVKIFMEEIKYFLLQNKDFRAEKSRKTVIRFLFIKHFYYSYYKKFRIGQSLTDTLLFQFQGRGYTMDQLLSSYKKEEISHEEILELLSEEENKENYLMLSLFEYHYHEEEKLTRENIANEAVAMLERKEESQKTDRIIWNLLGNGKSEYTNLEAAVAKFTANVLGAEADSQKEAWREFYINSGKRGIWKDNGTIFRNGIDVFLPLFQGFQITGESEKNWVRLLQFYDSRNERKEITVEFIENLNYCDLTKRRVFLQAIQLFCEYRIVGNVNQEKGYRTFFHHYFSAVFYLGYSDSYAFEPWKLELSGGIDSKKISYVKGLLEDMERMIESEKKELVISEAVEECEWIQKFIQKNCQLIETVSVKKPKEVKIETSFHSVRQNQEEYDRLLTYIPEGASETDKKAFRDEVEKSYREERINPGELKELMQKYESLEGSRKKENEEK